MSTPVPQRDERRGLDAAFERLSGMEEPSVQVDAALHQLHKKEEGQRKAKDAAKVRLEENITRARERRHEHQRAEVAHERLEAEVRRLKQERDAARPTPRPVGTDTDQKIEQVVGEIHQNASKGREG